MKGGGHVSATAHSSISKAARIGTSAPFDVFEVFFRCVSKDARDVIVSRAGSSVIEAVARESWCMGDLHQIRLITQTFSLLSSPHLCADPTQSTRGCLYDIAMSGSSLAGRVRQSHYETEGLTRYTVDLLADGFSLLAKASDRSSDE